MDGSYKGWNPYRERHLAIFVNCFLLMRQFNINEALTTDRHFEQEGFHRLLVF